MVISYMLSFAFEKLHYKGIKLDKWNIWNMVHANLWSLCLHMQTVIWIGVMETLAVTAHLQNHRFMMLSSNTDASKWGYGATLNGVSVGSKWAANDLLLYGYIVTTSFAYSYWRFCTFCKSL